MTKQQEEIIKELNEFENKQILLNINTAIQSFLLGFIDGRKKSPKSEINLLEGDTMKYKNIKIRKSINGVSWFARFRKNNKQYFISDKTQLGCYNKVKERYNKKEENIKENKLKFIEWYEQWLKLYKQKVKPGTLKDYKTMLSHTRKINNMEINKITGIDLINTINEVKSDRQKQKVYDFLKQVLQKAYINEIIPKNPINKVEKTKCKRETVIPLSNEDESKFIEYCINNNDDLHLIALYQGLRPGEAIALTIEDIDFKNKTISINKQLDYKNEISSTKNEYSNRIIPLTDKSLKILEKYKNTTGRLFKFSNDKAQDIFKNIKKELNLNPKYNQKSLRSTFITKCMEENIPLHIVQSWVGHVEGSKVTEQTYTKTRKEKSLFYFNKINT